MNNEVLKGFTRAFIIISVVLVILFFYKYNTWHDRDLNEFDITYRYEDDIKETKVVDDKEYKELYKKVNFEYIENNFGKEFFDIYYGKKEFTDEYYLFTGLINILGNELNINCNINRIISSFEVEMEVRNIFGNINLTNKSFTVDNGTFNVIYNDADKSYIVTTNKCSGFDFANGGIKTEYYKSSIVNDYLYIYEKVTYLDYSTGDNGELLFNYHNGVNKTDKIISNEYNEGLIKELPTYRLVFEKENNSYKFVSISRDY